MIRSVSVKRVTLGLIATVVIVGVVNFFRLHLLVFLSRSGYDWFWSHHVPHYTAYTLTIAGAVWYYYRSTVPRDVGSEAEAAADGSTRTVNA